MTVKRKIILKYPIIAFRNFRAKKIGKKISKETSENTKYPDQWRNDYLVKKCKKFMKLLNVDLEVKGWEKIPKAPTVLAANHASLFDPALIMVALANPGQTTEDYNLKSVFLAKDELKKHKKFIGYMNINDTFFISRTKPREALKTLDEFGEFVKENKKHAVIFPEGSRSKDGTVGEFKNGAFRVAKKNFLPIIPVTINNSLSISDTSRSSKLKVQVIFGDKIKPLQLISQENKDIAKRVKTLIQKEWVKPEGKRSEEEEKMA